ncbi:hypothetical protein BS329_09075 [Amycolatopsis coloradensis]|uniref:PABC domain-containing protein n=1 Tax=Amycolatopsis coloradensis TaxID=76021 RepID=A0A1R0KZ06_9PSEU|nr:hypothetical protein [Amycolatopsis coloradensis]OLZ54652.1 hypothetical protein BS329_09075 [Amycolatopsis coloradensis]
MSAELSAEALAGLSPTQKKVRLGEALFPLVQGHQPILAGQITGKLLEIDESELLGLLENDLLLKSKVDEVTKKLAQAAPPDATGQGAT